MACILKNIKIEKFRQLNEFTVDQFGDVNLIVGGNNAGKSTLLDAIRFFASQGSLTLVEELLAERGELGFLAGEGSSEQVVDKSISNLFHGRFFPITDNSLLHVGEKDGAKFVQMEHLFLREEYAEKDVDGESVSMRRLQKVSKNDLKMAEDLIESIEFSCANKDSIRHVWSISLSDFSNGRRLASRGRYEDTVSTIPVGYVASRLGSHTDLAEAWDAVVLTEGEQYALEALQLIEPEMTGIAFVQQTRVQQTRLRSPRSSMAMSRFREERSAVLKINSTAWPVPLQSMGDGMTRVLHIVLSAFRAKNGFLLIDEFENGLHYKLQTQVWQLLFDLAKKYDMQIFATTHSQDAVNAFAEIANQHELKGELIRMERDGKVTVASNISEDSLLELNRSKIEVR